MVKVFIQNGSNVFEPIIEDDIKWETHLKGQPGKLTFSVLKDNLVDFQEGNAVSVKFDNDKLFYGFVFKKERDKGQKIAVTAYDQLRYLKNKDTYIYKNKTANELIQLIAKDFNLSVGTLEATEMKIESRIEDNKCLFDIIQTALDLTLKMKKKMYVLYDDFGKLTLKNIESLKITDILLDDEMAENFRYASTIENDTYNKIKLSYENKETGKREIYIAKSTENINKWGTLQYFEKIDDKVNGKAKADALLELYNKKTRTLSISDIFGDIRIRAGCLIPVKLNLGDINVQKFMLAEKVQHHFTKDEHTMDITFQGVWD